MYSTLGNACTPGCLQAYQNLVVNTSKKRVLVGETGSYLLLLIKTGRHF